MTDKINDGGSAAGMSLRDAAALEALRGTLSNPEALEYLTSEAAGGLGPAFARLGRACWAISDAFIAARDGKS